jgi:hypothetical protein
VALAERPEPDGHSSVVEDDQNWSKLYCLSVYENDLKREWMPPGSARRIRVIEGLPRVAGILISGPSIARSDPDPWLNGVLYPALGDVPLAFQTNFLTHYGRYPDYTAAHAYDAANIVIAAIRQAGLNRPRIRDAVQAISPAHAITGMIEWDAQGQNHRVVSLRVFRTDP